MLQGSESSESAGVSARASSSFCVRVLHCSSCCKPRASTSARFGFVSAPLNVFVHGFVSAANPGRKNQHDLRYVFGLVSASSMLWGDQSWELENFSNRRPLALKSALQVVACVRRLGAIVRILKSGGDRARSVVVTAHRSLGSKV